MEASNPITLSNINDDSVKQLSEFEISNINNLLMQSVKLINKYKKCKSIIEEALLEKYKSEIKHNRRLKEYGVINIEDGDFTISHDLPKKISWDQSELQHISEILQSEGEDPTEFIDIKLNISERRYSSWPESIRSKFEPARSEDDGIEKISVKSNKS